MVSESWVLGIAVDKPGPLASRSSGQQYRSNKRIWAEKRIKRGVRREGTKVCDGCGLEDGESEE
jgi:hypothetical protein